MSNTVYPTSIDAPTNPTATSKLNSPSHSAQHGLENDAIVALETKVGVDSSAVVTTIDYLLKSTASVSPGHKHVQSEVSGIERYHNNQTDTGSANTYAIVSLPVISAYTAGDVFVFTAASTNTGSATLNVSAKGAKTIKKNVSTNLQNGDIISGQTVVVIYDGTNFQLISPIARLYSNGQTTYNPSTASGTQNIAHGLGVSPTKVRLFMSKVVSSTHFATSDGSWDSSGQSCSVMLLNAGNSAAWGDTTHAIYIDDGGGGNSPNAVGIVTVTATNIVITWTKNGSPTSTTTYIHWEAEV